MSVLKVLAYPDSRLLHIADSVSLFDEALSRFIDDLFETMYAEEGVGWQQRRWGICVGFWSWIVDLRNPNRWRLSIPKL